MTNFAMAYDCARHGWTPRQVIEMLGTAPGTISDIKAGFEAARDPQAFWGRVGAPPPPCMERNRVNAAERMRRLRADPAFREAERAKKRERMRRLRADPAFREAERERRRKRQQREGEK